ncbi:hypothetical protein ACFZDG_26900 [Kitasatospora xanthocidica]|uniref:hypothetical protein n=1 Tax=Kitasatospora xanthocidica TaxID=83382 RepID=UPI0036E69C94
MTRTTAVFVSVLTAGAVFATSTGAHAAEATHPRPASAAVAVDDIDDELPEADDAQWEALLHTITSIPESVLEQGDEATVAYLEAQQARSGRADGWFSFGCFGAVAIAIGTAVLPAAKMVKIAQVARRVGIKRIVSAIKAIRKGKKHTLGNDLQWVGAELLGLSGVQAACS